MRLLLTTTVLGFLTACGAPNITGESLINRAVSGGPATQPVLQAVRFLELSTHDARRMKGGIESTGIPSLAVLDTTRNGVETWLVEGGLSFALKQGVMQNTRGLRNDLMSAKTSQTIVAIHALRETTVQRQMAFIGPESQTVIRTFTCETQNLGPFVLEIEAEIIPTTVMAEICSDATTKFENMYWMRNSNGAVVQSRQWVSDAIGPIVLRDEPSANKQ